MKTQLSRLDSRPLSPSLGFTLVELMAVLAIASILMGAWLPSLTSLVRSVKLSSAADDLFGGLLLARSEAIKRNARVAICRSADGATCANSGGWEQGWIVFHDANNDGYRQTGELVVSRMQAMSSDLRLSGNLNVSRYVSYAPTGETKMASGAFQSGTITLCNPSLRGSDARQIVISASGRPRVQKTTVASCV
jgi:type IV fimbrial biogenesis protein FimT